MSSILLRYYLKRWAFPLFGALIFYGGLLLASDMVKQSQAIFSQGASFRWLVPFLLTTLPETLAMVLPMAAVLGGLMGTQQLSEGSEIVASQGLGVGMRALVKPWALLSAFLLVLSIGNAHFIVPRVLSLQNRLEAQMIEETKTRHIRPGAAPWYLKGNAGSDVCIWVSQDGQIHLMETSPQSVQHVVARNLTWFKDSNNLSDPSLILELESLHGCLVDRSSQSVVHLQEQTQRIRIPAPNKPGVLRAIPTRYLRTSELLSLRTAEAWTEFGRRLMLPFTTMALLLLGIGLGFGHPRFHKGGSILKSLGVIILYYFLMRLCEGQITRQPLTMAPLLALPFVFLSAAFWLLVRRLRPHRRPVSLLERLRSKIHLVSFGNQAMGWLHSFLRRFDAMRLPTRGPCSGILRRWTCRLWWRQWCAVTGSFLVLSLLLEFASLAGDLAKNHVSYGVFLYYWGLNLPSFMTIVLPIAFLLGGTLALSEAAQSREWVAIRASGTSLLQWVWSGFGAWALVLMISLLIDTLAAPFMAGKADAQYHRILNRPVTTYQSKPWLMLPQTKSIWHIDANEWWGFPMQAPGAESPILLNWKAGALKTSVLRWDGLAFTEGPSASAVFPTNDGLLPGRVEETSTLRLLKEQRLIPDPERATLFWGRLLNWLAGPCLLFAFLSRVFPAPREGRGKTLGFCLVGGLLFLGLQALFSGAARSGEIPPFWGVSAPLLILLGFGLFRLDRLRT